MPRIRVHNAQRKVRVDRQRLQQFAERALPLCLRETPPLRSELRKLDEVTIILVSDARIAGLHRQFMNIEGATDVITFQHGDVFISTETAQRQAKQFGTSTADELRLYVVHGLLHLHGFEDTTLASRSYMETVQRRLLAIASAA